MNQKKYLFYLLCSSIMFLVSKTLIALLMESANAEASDNSFDVIVPLESDLNTNKYLIQKSMGSWCWHLNWGLVFVLNWIFIPFQFILQKCNFSFESLNFSLSHSISFLLLIKLGRCLGQLLQGDVKLVLHMLHLLLQVSHLQIKID